MIANLFNTVFGCWHFHYSFPITVRRGVPRNAAALLTGTYVVCVDCGKEFPYDWHEMKILELCPGRGNRVPNLSVKEAA